MLLFTIALSEIPASQRFVISGINPEEESICLRQCSVGTHQLGPSLPNSVPLKNVALVFESEEIAVSKKGDCLKFELAHQGQVVDISSS